MVSVPSLGERRNGILTFISLHQRFRVFDSGLGDA